MLWSQWDGVILMGGHFDGWGQGADGDRSTTQEGGQERVLQAGTVGAGEKSQRDWDPWTPRNSVEALGGGGLESCFTGDRRK